MKAYKQINYRFENRIFFGYAGIMIVFCFSILLSPVFAQDWDTFINNNEPKVHCDVKKEFDKDGNLTGFDSTFTWYWSDKGFNFHGYDSLFKNLDKSIRPFYDHWNFPLDDSLGLSFFDFDDLSKFFNLKSNTDRFFDSQKSLREFLDQQEDFMLKFKEYQKEHQQLLEKYFSHPEKNESQPEIEHQRLKSNGNPGEKSKSGII